MKFKNTTRSTSRLSRGYVARFEPASRAPAVPACRPSSDLFFSHQIHQYSPHRGQNTHVFDQFHLRPPYHPILLSFSTTSIRNTSSFVYAPSHTYAFPPSPLSSQTRQTLSFLLAFTHFPPTSFLVDAPPQPHPTHLLFNTQSNHHLLSNILKHTRDCPSATQLSLLSIPLPFHLHLRFNNPYKTHTFKHSHKSSPFS